MLGLARGVRAGPLKLTGAAANFCRGEGQNRINVRTRVRGGDGDHASSVRNGDVAHVGGRARERVARISGGDVRQFAQRRGGLGDSQLSRSGKRHAFRHLGAD